MTLNIDFPNFNHPEVRAFYEHDLSIPKEIVAKILQLPRKTLIQDMEVMLMDSVHTEMNFLEVWIMSNGGLSTFMLYGF